MSVLVRNRSYLKALFLQASSLNGGGVCEMRFFQFKADRARLERETCIIFAAAMIAAWLKFVIARVLLGASTSLPSVVIPLVAVALTAVVARLNHPRLTLTCGAYAVFKLMAFFTFYWSVMVFHLGRSFPLIDAKLASTDAFLGFDFLAYMRFMQNHHWLNTILYPAYMSIFWQPLMISIVLILINRGNDALRLMLTFGLAINLTSLIALFCPAYGAYHFFGVTAALHSHIPFLETGNGTTAAIDWLRAASPIGEIPESHGGLISFPSFHTTAAALFIYYSRSSRLLLLCSCLLNAVMLLATPLHGSHYLVDMIAGGLVAIVVIAIVYLLIDWPSRRSLMGSRPAFAIPVVERAIT